MCPVSDSSRAVRPKKPLVEQDDWHPPPKRRQGHPSVNYITFIASRAIAAYSAESKIQSANTLSNSTR